jgi:hypothetical protein
MPDDFDAVLPAGRSCGSYRIGHRVHWIQGLGSAGATVVIRVSVAVHPSGLDHVVVLLIGLPPRLPASRTGNRPMHRVRQLRQWRYAYLRP